ncbi:MAG: DUF1015 family protein [Streptosporangiales bacterium]|nr:DUF1015 family protein [Streptosporangiales bacterium]
MSSGRTVGRPAAPQTDEATAGTGLVVRPFRGVRYSPAAVDLAAVTTPPYDVIDDAEARRLESREPHNMVRLVLPETGAPSVEARYARAATLLRQWLDSGVLVRDETPTLYVYEERGDDRVQRGLLGGIGLRAPHDRVILPHEDVHPVPVADRLAQMRATGANLEPIYLLAQGMGAATEVIADVVAHDRPLASTGDRTDAAYRLWGVSDPDRLRVVADALRRRQVLIADGHHRYAAYRRLQAHHRDAGHGAGAWDFGLALVVDTEAYPPTLQPIHRVLDRRTPADVLAALPASFAVHDAGTGLDAALDALRAAAGGSTDHHLVIAGDGAYRLLSLPRAAVDGVLPRERSAAWRALDVTAVHRALIDEVLRVPDDDQVFVHGAAAAVRLATERHGTALLLRPPSVADVFAVAAADERMPRKSTSFGPKPRGGVALRLLD